MTGQIWRNFKHMESNKCCAPIMKVAMTVNTMHYNITEFLYTREWKYINEFQYKICTQAWTLVEIFKQLEYLKNVYLEQDWIRFPSAFVWNWLGVSFACWTYNVFNTSYFCVPKHTMLTPCRQKYIRSLQWLWKTYSSCIHSLVADTLWSWDILPLKFPFTWHKHHLRLTTYKWLTEFKSTSFTTGSSYFKYIKSQDLIIER